MRSLESFLETHELHWIKLNEYLGIYELVLDNMMLGDFRSCPAYFFESYVEGWGGKGRNWKLEFGLIFHHMMEIYYREFRKSSFKMNEWGINDAMTAWIEADMDFHKEHKEYKSIGGVQGFCGLLLAYSMRYAAENERLRVIGTEISFGRNKEVCLGQIDNWDGGIYNAFLMCYLAGRMDILVDDGSAICPVDHKTMASFRGDPNEMYEMAEGPTGYIYATKKIIPTFLATIGQEDALLKRTSNKIIMNYISKAIPKEGERFRRLPIMKTDEQLEDYRLRMLGTSEDLFKALVRYTSTKVSTRDTSKCTNWFMSNCPYIAVHRQNSRANELAVLNSFYEKKPIWNTENVGQED